MVTNICVVPSLVLYIEKGLFKYPPHTHHFDIFVPFAYTDHPKKMDCQHHQPYTPCNLLDNTMVEGSKRGIDPHPEVPFRM